MKFTEFTPTIVPLKVDEDVFASILEQNFSALRKSINYIGQDLNSFNNQSLVLTAGELLAAGDLCVLNSSGVMVKADASTEATAKSLLGIATTAIVSGSTGKVLIKGIYSTTGLTTGDLLFVDTIAGDWTNSSPGSTGEIVRIIGYALSTTQLFFEPDRTWTEIE